MDKTAFDLFWEEFATKRLSGFDEQQLSTMCGVAKSAYVAATNRAAGIVLNPVGDRPLEIQIRDAAA
ncbi:hypothetical protein [Ralstonia sp. ASV6]|uniref:hypothetical protein n=1 Tax=Ralstonia sp. ASV6 TaxID=2795124 RepID=UPI0018EAF0CC|nr:hypothetical protein [Ralstonia sp. ASV6]